MFKKILVPVDLSTQSTSEKLCKAANDLAEKYDAEVRLMTVMPDYGMPLVASYFPEGAQDKLKVEMQGKLDAFASAHFTVTPSSHLIHGKRKQSILSEIENYQPDLVLIGCRRKKSRRNQRLLGSTGTAVADRASCSVMVIR